MTNTYYAVINPYTAGSEAITFAREEADNAIYHTKESAEQVRDRLADEHDNDRLYVGRVEITRLDEEDK